MKAVCESIYERGSHAIKYLRRRIPADVRMAYPKGRTHITRSLGTSDLREAKALARAESARIDEEFQRARQALGAQRMRLNAVRASASVHVHRAGAAAGHDSVQDEGTSFQALQLMAESGEVLAGMVRLLQSGDAAGALAALTVLLTAEDCRQTAPQAARQALALMPSQVGTSEVGAPGMMKRPAFEAAPLPTWDEVFEKWRDFVPDRPRSTAIAAQTPWRHLLRFMNARSLGGACASPALVTPVDMTAFVEDSCGVGCRLLAQAPCSNEMARTLPPGPSGNSFQTIEEKGGEFPRTALTTV